MENLKIKRGGHAKKKHFFSVGKAKNREQKIIPLSNYENPHARLVWVPPEDVNYANQIFHGKKPALSGKPEA